MNLRCEQYMNMVGHHRKGVQVVVAELRASADGIQNNIVAKARELDLPVSPEQVKVEVGGGKVAVAVDYTVPVDLVVYTLNLRFTPAAENRQL